MNRMIIAAGLAVAGYFGYKKLRKPTKNDYQSVTGVGPGGMPMKISTPVSPTITIHQQTGTPPRGKHPIGTPPIIVTHGGASSVTVNSVKDVQRALNTLGVASPPLKEDGKLGGKTSKAIREFQTQNGLLTVDGNAGPATRAALSAALAKLAGGGSVVGATAQNSQPESGIATTPSGAAVDTTPALKMTTIDVQHALNVLGASPPLTEDGKFGPRSVAAIKSFQTAHGLAPDGVAGPKTKTALYLASHGG